MAISINPRMSISFIIIIISIVVWVLLLINPGHIMTIEHCHGSTSGPSPKSLQMLLSMNPLSSQLLGWGLMVVAMMLPKLIMPVIFIHMRSLKRFRLLFSCLFVLGYLFIWMVAGIFMTAIIIGVNLLMPMSNLPALLVGLITLVWQFSPIKQRFLNLGHDHWNIPAFGMPAARNVFLFGIMHGIWCIGSGWLLMLFPMLLHQGHNLAMIIVTFIMISEHIEHPRRPKWHLNFRLKLFRIFIAQAKVRLVPYL